MKYEMHGKRHSPEYNVWRHTKTRCYNSKYPQFHLYGGRGITVCDRWRNSFENFISDMGNRPSNKHSLDRIDNEKGYSPENCRWATTMEQNRNRRNTIIVFYDGKNVPLADLAIRFGTTHKRIWARMHRDGMTLEDALTKKIRKWPSQL